jgi:SAM-dependent methyltransferase
MGFDYERDTKRHYQSDETARVYHEGFAGGWSRVAVTHRLVAWRERAVVSHFLSRLNPSTILDAPCGTGKLAPVFGRYAARVMAIDVSANMLAIAQQEYERYGLANASFRVADLTTLEVASAGRFDVAVCLRLMHRVPPALQDAILARLLAVSERVIVSFGVESPYHRARRRVRNSVFGGGTDALCFESLAAIRQRLDASCDVLGARWILPGVSQEWIALLRAKQPVRAPRVA